MMGLVIFGLLLGYLAIAVAGTIFAVRMAGTGQASTRQRWAAGIVVGLIFYLIPFWDWIPTVVAHKYYCATEAKFEVFRTFEQWMAENATALPTVRNEPPPKPSMEGRYQRYPLYQRVVEDRTEAEPVFLSVTRTEGRIVDTSTNKTIATFVDFGSGYASLSVGGEGAWKFWLKRVVCDEGENSFRGRFGGIASQFVSLGRKKP